MSMKLSDLEHRTVPHDEQARTEVARWILHEHGAYAAEDGNIIDLGYTIAEPTNVIVRLPDNTFRVLTGALYEYLTTPVVFCDSCGAPRFSRSRDRFIYLPSA